MASPRVLILYNYPRISTNHPDAASEHSVIAIAQHIGQQLKKKGYQTSLFGLRDDPAALVHEVNRTKPVCVFNLFEGSVADTGTECYVAALLEWIGVPFTGCPYRALTLAQAKDVTKRLLRGAGLPTADFFVVDELPVPRCTLPWPVIVKPAHQDASIGLAQESVVTSQKQLERRVEHVLETYGPPVLVEEFIDGREFNVAVLELPELECLPPGEIIFKNTAGHWPILTYNGKWDPKSPEYLDTPPQYPARISGRLADRLTSLARRAYRLVGCRDYARVDLRVRAGGQPYILEVNPNPEISRTAGFAASLKSAGIRYIDFLVRLVEHAAQRPSALSAKPKSTAGGSPPQRL